MQHTTQADANHLLQAATVFTVATVDTSGFPTTVALSALKTPRSLTEVFFYTSRQTATVQNSRRHHRATIFCYDQTTYASLMLKGTLTEVGEPQLPANWRQQLTPFQHHLAYKEPIILRFQTLAIKVRPMMTIDHLELRPHPTN
ncbi:pyridoxamine 5'-phosphate oxidase family protein [Lactiplantibacillus daowaiensis]|uniref:Pyridoxamine 5'-phosphate oxidase family protein n=1 Tax=Lactiplantibacillus daowaiensis TaxID=2559918 RepID=A0ABW1RZ25_9LACO|nr:pyridoxamine 5'-phosphate oxidase family protein [Lactiplantibacillus daowaiensis]